MEPVVYLDYNATAPLRPEALAAMLPVLRAVGNAASPHALGREAAASVAIARKQVASLLGCSTGELIFTSGATEANNMALRAATGREGRVIISAVEHPAVLKTARALAQEREIDLSTAAVDGDGYLDLHGLERHLETRQPTVVSIMAANNETGVLSDLSTIVAIAHASGAIVHSDATQLVGKLPIDLSTLDVDLLSLSAHKFGGPQGVGALFIRRGLGLPQRPLLHGGEQEGGWRAGTLNVAGIVGAGVAAAVAQATLPAEMPRIRALRDLLEISLTSRLAEVRVNGARQHRLPHVSSLTFAHAPADAVLAAMPGVAASDGSACSSGAPTPSHVLLAMGRSHEDADCTVRFSLGYETTTSDIERAIEAVTIAVTRIREALGIQDQYRSDAAVVPTQESHRGPRGPIAHV